MNERPGFPDVVEIVVEIPRGSRNKYEFDEAAGVFRLDRVLSSAVFYNFDYGFIEGTRAGDGDHTDALLIIDEPTFTGCHVWARPVGGLEMRDEKGFDFKVLCVALGDAHQAHIDQLEQMRPHRLVEIEQFFATYKALEDKTVEILGWRDRGRALDVLRTDRVAWEAEIVTDRLSGASTRPRWPGADLPGRRIFVAAPLPADASAAIAEVVERVRAEGVPGGGRDVRWVRLDGLHLTLRFLGPTVEDRVSQARDAVREAAGDAAPISVTLGGAGTYPTGGRPRALWLGVRQGADALADLAARLDRALVDRGWPAETRPFRAHLTLARADGVPAGAAIGARLEAASSSLDATFELDRIGLFESLTGGGPARYEPLELAALGEARRPG